MYADFSLQLNVKLEITSYRIVSIVLVSENIYCALIDFELGFNKYNTKSNQIHTSFLSIDYKKEKLTFESVNVAFQIIRNNDNQFEIQFLKFSTFAFALGIFGSRMTEMNKQISSISNNWEIKDDNIFSYKSPGGINIYYELNQNKSNSFCNFFLI